MLLGFGVCVFGLAERCGWVDGHRGGALSGERELRHCRGGIFIWYVCRHKRECIDYLRDVASQAVCLRGEGTAWWSSVG